MPKRVVKRFFSGTNVTLYFSFWGFAPIPQPPPLDPAGDFCPTDPVTQLDTPIVKC